MGKQEGYLNNWEEARDTREEEARKGFSTLNTNARHEEVVPDSPKQVPNKSNETIPQGEVLPLEEVKRKGQLDLFN